MYDSLNMKRQNKMKNRIRKWEFLIQSDERLSIYPSTENSPHSQMKDYQSRNGGEVSFSLASNLLYIYTEE